MTSSGTFCNSTDECDDMSKQIKVAIGNISYSLLLERSSLEIEVSTVEPFSVYRKIISDPKKVDEYTCIFSLLLCKVNTCQHHSVY